MVDALQAAAEPPRGPAALHALLAHPLVKAALPGPAFLLFGPILYLVFRKTWARIDLDARRERAATMAEGAFDARPAVAAFVAAFGLTLQEYYGGAATYFAHLHPRVVGYSVRYPWLRPALFAELYNYVFWSASRVFVYVILPFTVWKIAFPRDSLLDMGLRPRGLRQHAWVYLACLALVAPCVLLVARQPDFGAYYPFYRQASRSWLDFIAWELLYFAQFVGLEIFFRGFWLAVLRRQAGSAAIFSMVVPYCMIHYGKPYLEANGAVLAGVVLGTLAMKTRSIYAGLGVHLAVALGMDVAVLASRGGLPRAWVPW
ncbi:MAG TPA: CPBP family intramembrane glutamic endopeptidase [Polyangiaceae bacterium]|nr:CPBP family intramembrane glutamic endopeptidase [Polyangiaceae bacterium]